MTSTPRTSIDDGYAQGLDCAICGSSDLFIQHLPDYPDFVTCSRCASAFVVEDGGERVLYGNISPDFPRTAQFALKQWVWLEAVERRAELERPAPPSPEPEAPAPAPEAAIRQGMSQVEPEPEVEEVEEEALEGPDTDWLASRLKSGGLSAGVPIPTEPEPYRPAAGQVSLSSDTGPTRDSLPAWLRDETPAAPAPPLERPSPPRASPPLAAAPAKPSAAEKSTLTNEPPPGQRHRVVVRGDRVLMPVNACAHCRRAPATDRLPIPGSLPRVANPTQRRSTTFQVPLCRECTIRARQRSGEQRSAALMGHLTGALVGLVLVVAGLATNLLPVAGGLPPMLASLGGAWFAGYAVTALLLVGRSRRAPAPEDAAFVLTTLRVGSDPAVGHTAFEFRQRETAIGFLQANGNAATTGPTPVPDTPPTS